MKIFNILKVAFSALNRNKLRTILTMLGVIIGVAAVIAMLAVGQGANKRSSADRRLGTNVIIIFPAPLSRRGSHPRRAPRAQMTEGDAAAMKKLCPALQYATPLVRATEQVKIGNQNWRTSVYGAYPEYVTISATGRSAKDQGFTDADEHGATKVCIIG